MSNSQLVQVETLRSIAFGSITNSYAILGSAFANPIRILGLINNTDGDMLISLDGSNPHFFVAAHSYQLLDFGTNRKLVDQVFVVSEGTQVFIKYSTAPSVGSFYVEAVYGVNPIPLAENM